MTRALSLFVLALVAGCSGNSNFSVSARGGALGPPGGGSAATDVGISIDRVRMVVRKIELEGRIISDAGMKVDRGHDHDRGHDRDHDEVEVVVGPFLIDLSGSALDGGIRKVFDAEVAPGVFDELEFQIRPVRPNEVPPDGGLAALAALRASVVADGKVGGADGGFSFVSGLEAEQEREGRFVVSAAPNATMNITLNVDTSRWFVAKDGTLLDPRDPANRPAIEQNIRASIDIFDDHDGIGRENHGDDHGHGGGGHH